MDEFEGNKTNWMGRIVQGGRVVMDCEEESPGWLRGHGCFSPLLSCFLLDTYTVLPEMLYIIMRKEKEQEKRWDKEALRGVGEEELVESLGDEVWLVSDGYLMIRT